MVKNNLYLLSLVKRTLSKLLGFFGSQKLLNNFCRSFVVGHVDCHFLLCSCAVLENIGLLHLCESLVCHINEVSLVHVIDPLLKEIDFFLVK